MKNYIAAIIIILSFCSIQLYAQEIDTIPINTKDLNIKLKRSPLPSRLLPLSFEPVKLKPLIVNAKVNYWKTKTAIGININQAAFSDNWKGGGVNSLAVGGLLNYKAEYNKNSYSYVSEVILQYGKVKNKNQLQKKTTDRIYWDNKASFQLSKNWFFFGSINFESQFDNGYSYSTVNGTETARLISKFMGPGYLTESVGFEYKPNKYFSTRIGTGTARQTFVLDQDLAQNDPTKNFGVPLGKTFRNELAFQVVSAFDKDIFTNTNLKARYAMFIPYENIGWVRIDHRLDVALTAKINRFMNTSLTGVVLFDKDTDPKVQASQTLALGFAFVFPR